MRVWLQEGKQKELLLKEKQLERCSWKELANSLNVAPSRLNSWFYEENLMPEDIFKKLRLSPDYIKFLIQKLPEGWGRIKGGKLSPGNTKIIKIPEKNEELAELWGILLGDGHIEKTQAYKIGVYHIKVTGHAVLDKDYLINFVKPLGEKLFGVHGRTYLAKTNLGFNIIFDGRNIVNFFEKEGFKAGDKIRNQSTIPNWIKEDPKFLAACLRGLYDTDGCFYHLTNQTSYQVCLTNYNKTLLNDVRGGLLSLGIGCSKISKGRDITITKKSEIAKFYKLIGFHNSKHLNKIKIWNAKFSPV